MFQTAIKLRGKAIKKCISMILVGAMISTVIPLSLTSTSKAAEQNILKGKPTMCTYHGDSGHACKKAVDEKFNTSRWGSNDKTPQAIQIDMGAVYEIDTIKAYLFGNKRKYTYEYYVTMEPTIKKENGGNGKDNFVGENPVVSDLHGVGYGWADPDGEHPTPASEIRSEDYTFKKDKPVGRYLTLRVTKCDHVVCLWDIQAFGTKVDGKPKGDLVLEAEEGTFGGGCQIKNAGDCSNGQYVGYVGMGNTITWKADVKTAGSYTVDAYFLSKDARDIEFTVNGEKQGTLACQAGKDWNSTVVKSKEAITLKLKAGENIIVIGNEKDDAPNMDCIVLTLKEAEKEPEQSDDKQEPGNEAPPEDTETPDNGETGDIESPDNGETGDIESPDNGETGDTELPDNGETGDTESPGNGETGDTELPDDGETGDTESPGNGEAGDVELPDDDKDGSVELPGNGESGSTESSGTGDSEEMQPPKSEEENNESFKPGANDTIELPGPGANDTTTPDHPAGGSNQESSSSTAPEQHPEDGAAKTEQPAKVFKGGLYWYKNLEYKVTKVSTTGKGTVELVRSKSKKITMVTVPGTIEIEGKKYNVTSIGKNAFKNCKKLKKIVINTLQLKNVGKNAFKGIKSTATIKVPASKWKKYISLCKGKGQGRNIKFKKK